MNRFGDIDCSLKRLPPIYGYHSEKLVSIEKSLESIEEIIEELPRYIKIAKKHCHFPSEHELTKDQSAAIYIYTMEWGETSLYRVLNQALRSENRQALKIWFPYLKLFDTALEQLPTVKEVIWRGIPIDIGKNFHENEIITWWSINSCSSSVNVIKSFLGNNNKSTLFLIEAINGKKIRGYTEFENENEIILSLGTQFRVKCDALEQSNGSHIVHLIEINNDDDQPLESVMNNVKLIEKSSIKFSSFNEISNKTKWKEDGITIAGGYGRGNRSNQFSSPQGICIDDENECIYVADSLNHRIVQWKFGAKTGQIVAGGNGAGNQTNQLDDPTDVIFVKKNNCLLICDYGNRRIMRWSCHNKQQGEIIVDNIDCISLTIDNRGHLYISDYKKHEVIRWIIEERKGSVVAGGNEEGENLNQFSQPHFLFIDKNYSLYVSDWNNHRVMKWVKDAQEGIVVAGGKGPGNNLAQLNHPEGIFVDYSGNVYVADSDNFRVTCWSPSSTKGRLIVGGNDKGNDANQFTCLQGLTFDRYFNLYVADSDSHRIQQFSIHSN